MKYIFLFLAYLPLFATAQTKAKYEEPMLDGNKDGLSNHLAKHMTYPEFAREKGISGKAVFKFKVDTTGKIDSLVPLFSTHHTLETEAARALALADGQWKPASRNGNAISAWYYVTLSFQIDGNLETAKGNRIAKGYEYYKAGVAKYNEGLDADAIAALRAAYTIDQDNTDALYNVALIYINSGEYDMACFYLNMLKQEAKRLAKDMEKEVDNMLDLHCKD